MISISFSGIKMLWLLGGEGPRPPLLSLFFSSFMPHFSPPPPKNENMKRYAYAEMLSVRFFCGNAHRHLIIHKYRHFIRCILFPTSVIRKVNLQHPHPTRNVIVSCQEIESYRYIKFVIPYPFVLYFMLVPLMSL